MQYSHNIIAFLAFSLQLSCGVNTLSTEMRRNGESGPKSEDKLSGEPNTKDIDTKDADKEDNTPIDKPKETPDAPPLNSTAKELFQALSTRSDALVSFDFQGQVEIDKRTTNATKGSDPLHNEQVVYDATKEAARIKLRASTSGTNRVPLNFPSKSSGHLVCIWDYFSADEWASSNTKVFTHKMFMIGSKADKDHRVLENRFHYAPGTETGKIAWSMDMRPYSVGETNGPGAGLGRMTPWHNAPVPVGKWNRFFAEVWFDSPEGPIYTLKYRTTNGDLATIYDKAPLTNLLTAKKGLDYFDPTYANTSQDQDPQNELTHGWLRNAVVLWSESPIDMKPIYAVKVEN